MKILRKIEVIIFLTALPNLRPIKMYKARHVTKGVGGRRSTLTFFKILIKVP